MGKTILLCLIFAAICLSSCEIYTTKEKLATFNRITEINDSLDNMTREWHNILDNAVSSKNYTNLRPYRLYIGTFLNRNRNEVAYFKVNSNSEHLIDSEEVFLDKQANVVSDLYASFDAFTETTPDETIQGQLKLIIGDQQQEAAGSAAIKRSLAAFAARNNLAKKAKQLKLPVKPAKK